ncbi:hypothetical protein [Streptomyces spinosirectus]
MAHTFVDLVTMQRAADEANAHVLALRDEYDRPAEEAGWSDEQTARYEQAWRDWRELADGLHAAVTAYAKDEREPRFTVEAQLRRTVRHPEPVDG